MKKTIAFSMLLIISISLFAQSDYSLQYKKDSTLLYKPYEEFKGDTVKHLEYWSDTIAYLSYNFIKRISEAYTGMTVQEFVDMLPFPIVKIKGSRCLYYSINSLCKELRLYVVSEYPADPIDGKCAHLFIVVGIDTEVKKRDRDKEVSSHESDIFLSDIEKNTAVTYAFIYNENMEDYKRLMGVRQLYAKKKKEEAAKE
ncbi:MAG: hypothetical protein LBV43_03560 [Prevotella sp.]|jgi:hypothetical protein|nr:hypothetical protein [Prevotella sp.]